MVSCRARGFCPSGHAKRLEEWGEWMQGELLLDVPHRQVVFTIPKMLRLEEIFAREVLHFLVRKELLSPEWAERLLSWRHTGFSVHSLVRATTKPEAERVGKYMIRPVLALERLSFLEPEGKVGYRYGQGARDQKSMDYLEFIARARVTSHIPDKGQVMVRYYGLYANAHRGKIRKASLTAFPLRIMEDELRPVPSSFSSFALGVTSYRIYHIAHHRNMIVKKNENYGQGQRLDKVRIESFELTIYTYVCKITDETAGTGEDVENAGMELGQARTQARYLDKRRL